MTKTKPTCLTRLRKRLAKMREIKILLASGNLHKVREFSGFFSELPPFGDAKLTLISPGDLSCAFPEVEETGASYEENALLKAAAFARAAGMPAIADDSGIEVRALGGEPGIRSARASEGSDSDRVNWLLDKMKGIRDRGACFAACLVIAFPNGKNIFGAAERDYFSAEGRCFGTLAESPRGTLGFGYDPIFTPDGYGATFGELGDEIKSRISHRAIAFKGVAQIVPSVLKYIAVHHNENCNGDLGRCTN